MQPSKDHLRSEERHTYLCLRLLLPLNFYLPASVLGRAPV